MPADSSILDKSADELGIDSLIAGEMRSWMVKELNIRVPLLVIIGGNNMQHVAKACQSLLDPAMTPLLHIVENNKEHRKEAAK